MGLNLGCVFKWIGGTVGVQHVILSFPAGCYRYSYKEWTIWLKTTIRTWQCFF